MNAGRAWNVLFLCTGNSARSVIAESILREIGARRFRAFSAGSHPTGTVNPFALDYLRTHRLPTDGLRSKSWSEFAQPDSPALDFVITVCDNAAGEACPVWPGQPITAHWGIPDPAAVEGSDDDRRRAFRDAGRVLTNRIRIFASLPIATLDRMSVATRLAAIGRAHQLGTAA
jgi:arsenate reductase